jgi:AraC-like DNA-binding protein
MKRANHLLLHEVVVEPAEEWSLADAAGWLFIRLSKGDGYWLGTSTAFLNSGDVLVLPPGDPGLIRASQLSKVTLHYFLFHPELLTGFFTLAEQNYLCTLATQDKGKARYLAEGHPAVKEFASLVESRPNRSELSHRCHMLEIISYAFEEQMQQARPKLRNQPTARQRFLELVNQMPAGELINHSHDQLAQLCRCGRRHFSRLFRDYFGMSLRHQQSELRAAEAIQKLHQALHQTSATMPGPGVRAESETANQRPNA